jgi:lipid-A-disaccharide synthase-like uncharacterized protein
MLPMCVLATAATSAGLLSSWYFWLAVGFTGQAVFTARMLVQWIASERKRDSVVPAAFWWLSLVGGVLLLSYAIRQRDPVIIAGQALGSFIYARNLILIGRRRREGGEAAASEALARAEPLATAAVVSSQAATDGASAIPRPHLATGVGHESRNGHAARRSGGD